MSILDSAQLLLRASEYSGSGDWLDEANSHDAQFGDGSTGGTFPVFVASTHFTFDGAQYFSISDDAGLDFAAGESLTAMVRVAPTLGTPASSQAWLDKGAAGGAGGWSIYHFTDGTGVASVSDGANHPADQSAALSNDTWVTVATVRDVPSDNVEAFLDGVGTGSPATDSTTGTLANAVALAIGKRGDAGAAFFIGKLSDAVIWRSKLTGAQLVEADYYLTNGVPSVAVTGTAVAGGVTEGEIITGGETIILTLTNDTWHADVGSDSAATTALIAGLDSDGAETAGWDAVVKANLVFGDVARTSDTVVTVTLGAEPTYQITADETITVTIPAAAINGPEPFVAAPTFDVTAYVPPSEGSYAGYGSVGALRARITADGGTPNGFEPPALVAQIVGSTIQSEVLGHLTGFAGATERGTLGALLEVIAADGGTITDVGDVESALVRFAEVYEP